MKVIAVTGYKSLELGISKNDAPEVLFIKLAIKRQLIPLLEDGLEWVIISGGLGVELWTAEVVFDLQFEYPDLKLAILTPFLNQDKKWNEQNQEFYQMILEQADFVDSITKKEYENPVQFRLKNQFIVAKSDGLLILYDEEREGSPKYMKKAAILEADKRNYPIYQIDFYDLQSVVEEETEKYREYE